MITRIVWRDRRFAVVEVTSSDGDAWSVSGQPGSVMEDMPFVAEVERRPATNAAYGEQFRLVGRGEAPSGWRRLAGAAAWHRAVGGGAGPGALEAMAALRWAVGGGDLDLADLPAPIRHAALLGEADLDWLAEVAVRSYGRAGPDVIVASPCSFLTSGLLEADEALRLAVVVEGSVPESQRQQAAVGLVYRQLVRAGRCAMSARRARALVTESLGVSPTSLVDRGFTQVASSFVPTELVEAEGAVESECRRIIASAERIDVPAQRVREMSTDGAMVTQHVLEAAVSVVVSPAGADGGFLRDLIGGLDGLVGVSVRHADCRGSLIGRWPGSEHPDASVVVLTDVHRLGAWGLVQALAQVEDGRRVVLVGDDWQWSPGELDGVFVDVVRGLGVPVRQLRGDGAAWALRGGSDIRQHPTVHAGAPQGDVVARRLRFAEPAGLVERAGNSVMVAERHADLGVGTLGRLGSVEGEMALVDLGRAIGERRVPRRILAGGDQIAFGWLPGVRCRALRLTKPVRSVQGAYAALAAAQEIWVDELGFLANLGDEPNHGLGLINSLGSEEGRVQARPPR